MNPKKSEADQLYTLADLQRMLKVPPQRMRELRQLGQMREPDVIIPGGGHKAARWSASQVRAIQADWSPRLALAQAS